MSWPWSCSAWSPSTRSPNASLSRSSVSISSGVPEATRRLAISITESQWRASSRWWVVMITMAPRDVYSSITSRIRSWLGMSKPVTGSSSMMMSGSPASTWAIRTLCCCPPLSSPKLRFLNWFTSSCSPASRMAARSSAPEPSEQPPLAVAAHGQHLSRGYGHPAGGKMLAHVGQILGHAADAARGGLLQTGHALQHGRLARSVDAHHRRRRARLEAVGHAIERGDLIEPYGKFLDLDGVHHGRVFLTDRLPIRSASGPNGIFPPCHPPPLPLWKRAERSPRTARQPTRCRPALPTRLHG